MTDQTVNRVLGGGFYNFGTFRSQDTYIDVVLRDEVRLGTPASSLTGSHRLTDGGNTENPCRAGQLFVGHTRELCPPPRDDRAMTLSHQTGRRVRDGAIVSGVPFDVESRAPPQPLSPESANCR